jgi:hypothetical protein
MRTVFDLVGKFCVVTRLKEGEASHTSMKTIVLHSDMSPNQCTGGRSVLRQYALRLAAPHIKTKGLERMWLEDWDLKERHIREDAKAAA